MSREVVLSSYELCEAIVLYLKTVRTDLGPLKPTNVTFVTRGNGPDMTDARVTYEPVDTNKPPECPKCGPGCYEGQA